MLLYTLLGFIAIPYLIQHDFSNIIKKELNTNAYLGTVYLNPYTFEFKIKNLLVKDNNNETLLYFENLSLDFELLSLFKNEIKLKHFFIDNIKSTIVLYKDEKLNFTHILEQLSKNDDIKNDTELKEDTTQKQTKPLVFKIDSFLFSNIHFVFTDKLNKSDTNLFISTLSSKLNLLQSAEQLDINIDDFIFNIPSFHFANNRFDILTNSFEHSIKNIKLSKKDDFEYTLSDVLLSNKSISFQDKEKDIITPLYFTDFSLLSKKFTNIKSDTNINQVTLSLNTPKQGTILLNTQVSQNPLNLDGNLNIADLTIVPYKNYIKDFINLDIKNTIVDVKSNFNITDTTQNVVADVNISDIELFHLISKKELLNLTNLTLENIHYTNNNLIIDKVLLDTFSTRFKIAQDKTTNMDNLTENSNTSSDTEKKQEQESEQKSDFSYHIKNLELKNGEVAFSDHSLPLNFDTNIHDLHSVVDDLSSSNQETTILLKGVVEKYGMANVKAKTLLANFKEKTDVTVSFENLDVRSYSPYSGKFIGQKISDGRLWLDLNYKIKDAQLLSTNNLKIKNLTLGEDVESPDALSLPVGLAIALLEDSDGLIELDVPIVGDMSNPEFQLGGVIWKTLGNIVTNIVSAPFKFLGSLLGLDSDELGVVEFGFAQAKVLPPQKEKLDQLVTVLNEKKHLILELQTSYDKEKDTLALQNIKFEELIKSKDKEQKIEELYIARFTQEKFNTLKKETKNEKLYSLLSSEIKNTIIVQTSELENLAKQRVQNIQEYFVSHKLTLDRIQIKDKVVDKKSSSDLVFTLQLELNIKDN